MQSKSDGEAPPRKGDIFQRKVIELLRDLEYQEKVRRRFGLDFIADSPPEKIEMPRSGLPEKRFLRPFFSPKGRTAFEFKAGIRLRLEKIAEELSEKIDKINADPEIPVKEIIGGVVVTDIKVPIKKTKKTLSKYGIYIWDIDMLCFLASKVCTETVWKKSGVTVLEERLNDWTTVLRCVGTYPNCLEIKAAIYYQNPFKMLELETTDDILESLTQRVQDITKELTLTTYVGLEVHSLSGTTEELDENFRKILKKHNLELIKYTAKEPSLTGYDIAPWQCFLSIIKR